MNNAFIFSGIQLIPNNPNKYVQVTNTPTGIHLEDWIVKVISMCGEELGDISTSFLVEDVQVNSDNGDSQILWSLKNIPIDFGFDLIYLKISQALGETFYSQPFKITAIESEKVCQINYKYREFDEIQSIGFCAWFSEEDLLQDLTTYYEISTQSWVSASIDQGKIEIWRTQKMPKSILMQLKNILGLPYVYINGVRASLKEAPEIPRKVSRENFAEMSFIINFHYDDVFVQPDEDQGDWAQPDWDNDDFLTFNN